MITALIAFMSMSIGDIDFADFKSPADYVVPIRDAYQGMIALKASLNHKEKWFLLDTGAIDTYLREDAWEELKPGDKDEVEVDLQCGQLSEKLPVYQLPGEVDKAFANLSLKVDGVLGLDFLKDCAVGLDLTNSVVALFPAKMEPTERFRLWFGTSAYIDKGNLNWIPWTSSASVLSKDRLVPLVFRTTSPGYQAVEMHDIEGRSVVTLDISGVKMDSVVDTGASATTLLATPLKNVTTPAKNSVSNYSVNGEQSVSVGHLKSIKVGNFELATELGEFVHLTDQPVLESLGLLGIDLLSSQKVLMDFRSQTLGLARFIKVAPFEDSSRYYLAEIYDPAKQKVMRFRGGFTFSVTEGSVVLSGASHVHVISAKDGTVAVKIE